MDRNKINIINIFLTLCLLFIAIEISNGSFATRINKISENLDKALSEVMIDNSQPNFTEITNNASYIDKIHFYPKGMAGLYNLTMVFMDFLLTKDIYPEGFLILKNNRIEIGSIQDEWRNLLLKYWGVLLIIIVILLIIAFMPLCGFCFCCCRCCGKCGARTRPCDKKHDLCRKILLATLLIGLGTLLLFGVVCAFASNEQMQDGIDSLPDNLRKTLKDTNNYIQATNDQVNVLLITNYNEFEAVLLKTMEQSNNIVYDELANYSNATSMTELANIVEKLPVIRNGFDTLKYSTNSLRSYAQQLNDAVRKVKKDLLLTLSKCTMKKCADINKNISSLQTNIHFNSYIDRYFPRLPDITEQITKLNELDQNAFERAVNKGKQNLEKVKTEIGHTVNTTLTKANNKINEAGRQIKTGSKNVTRVMNNLKKKINEISKPILDKSDEYIRKYSHYRYYLALGLSCTLLLICLCITLGLICGICGKRPDVYGDDDCCNKGAGSQFLICGVMLMFLTAFIIAIVVLVSFLFGITIERFFCNPIQNPRHSQLFNIIDRGVNLSQIGIDFSVSQALDNCYKNKSIYKVFNLKSKFDLDKVDNYLDSFNISGILNSLDMSSIAFSRNFHILDDKDNETLQDLATSDFADINFDNFKEILEDNFTTFNLSDLSNELGILIKEIQSNDDLDKEILTGLHLAKMNLETYQEKIVEPMIKNATAVVELAKKLDYDLRLGHNSFKSAINYMLRELQSAENTLILNGTDRLKKIARNFTNGIVKQVKNYLNRIVNITKHDIGQCGPLHLIINNTLAATCDKILLPWNGFWFGMFWSMILFIPTIFVSVKLSKLYQKYNPYRENLFEAEYLYDAYADRDNIPLNSRGGKAKKKNKKYKRYEDRPVTTPAGDMVTREYPPGASHHPETRYADIAPKHWEEFPAGGPPQYQRAPTEYERPPPYYYPGATENQ